MVVDDHLRHIERDRPLALALSATIHPYAHSSLNDEMLSWADRLLTEGRRPGDDRDNSAIVMASSATRLLRHDKLADGAELARQEGVSLASLAAVQCKTGQVATLATFDAAIQHWLMPLTTRTRSRHCAISLRSSPVSICRSRPLACWAGSTPITPGPKSSDCVEVVVILSGRYPVDASRLPARLGRRG